ncbi:hypothetical protein CRE_14535 [Caenorhabditis remanei]|uniref:Smr domain-containing protein n=1 Tax=Caenorhabditis remanei TaxID=31234 RepID=E3M9E5_CAERE|nr:hypothetical protein CRE_14535 [Caenorhabditis remanei]
MSKNRSKGRRGYSFERVRVVYSPKYTAGRASLQSKIKQLYGKLNKNFLCDKKNSIIDEINKAVIDWNAEFSPRNEIDLHGMTREAALDYVEKKVEERGHIDDLTIITGQGHHSKDNQPVIKQGLLKKFRSRVQVNTENPGKLVLVKRQKLS